jgi:hypothetical protein
MSFQIIYKDLFDINILHHYFLNKGEDAYDAMDQRDKAKMELLYDAREVLEIVPTEECRDLLAAHQCLFKATRTGLIVGIKASRDSILPAKFNPFSELSDDLIFRFLIKNKDQYFGDYTALPLNVNRDGIYVFKNYKVTADAKFPSLSANPPVFKPLTDYFPGDMLADNAVNPAKIFTALYKTSQPTSNATDWLSETGDATTPLSYANISDRYPVVSGILNYTMNVQEALPEATFKNLSGVVLNPKTVVTPGDFYTLQADLRTFPEGFYSLHVECSNPVYQDDLIFYLIQNKDIPFGMIEIKVKSDLAGYDLLDQGHLRSPVFQLRFRNRRVSWRYSGKYFNSPYVVPEPLPLTRFGHIDITKPPAPEDSNPIMLPNPSDPVIRPEALIKPTETKYYSDIQIF